MLLQKLDCSLRDGHWTVVKWGVGSLEPAAGLYDRNLRNLESLLPVESINYSWSKTPALEKSFSVRTEVSVFSLGCCVEHLSVNFTTKDVSRFLFPEKDLIPTVATFLLCLVLGVEYGILVGVGVNIVLLLYPSARPYLHIEKAKVTVGLCTGSSRNSQHLETKNI